MKEYFDINRKRKKKTIKEEERAVVQGIVNTPILGNKNLLPPPLMSSRRFLDSGKGHFLYHKVTLIIALQRRLRKERREREGKVLKEDETSWERRGNV